MNAVDAFRALRRPPTTPEVESPPAPEALYRDFVFEVFEAGVGITYHDVSKPGPNDAPQLSTYT